MTVQEEYEKIKARMEQQVKYGLPVEKSFTQPSEVPEIPESGWKTTKDGIKYQTITIGDYAKEGGINYDRLVKELERQGYKNEILNTEIIRIEQPDGSKFIQTPKGEQVSIEKFNAVMSMSYGGGGYFSSPKDIYNIITGAEKDYKGKYTTVSSLYGVIGPLSPTSSGLETELAEIEKRNIEHEIGENVLRLDTGEYVPESQWYSLSATDQQILKTQGIEAFNSVVSQRVGDYENQVKTFLGETGGNYEYWKSLTPEKQKEYLEQSGWQPVKTEAGTQVGYSYDISRGETAEKYAQWKRGEITEQQWMNYVKGVTERAAGFTIPPSPIHIENFITSYGGNVETYRSIPTEEGKQVYIQSLQMINLSRLPLAVIEYAKSDYAQYSQLSTGEDKFNFLKDKGYIPENSKYSGETDELGDPLIYTSTNTPIQDFNTWLDTPMWGRITPRTILEDKLLHEYASPSSGRTIILMPEAGGRDWNIDAINNAFQVIPYEKKVYFDVPEVIQQAYDRELKASGSNLTGQIYAKLIDIDATWKGLTDNEKSLVLANYNPTPSGIEQAIDAAHIPILYTVKNWGSMGTLEKVISVATDITLFAPLLSPVTKPLSALASRAVMTTSIGERATSIISNISRDVSLALKSGDATRLMGAGTKLRVLGEELTSEGIEGGSSILRIGSELEQKAPTVSSWGKGLIDDLSKLESTDIDVAISLQRGNKPVANLGVKEEMAIGRADERLSAYVNSKVSEVNNVIEGLQTAVNRADLAASQNALQKLDNTLNKLAPFADEVKGFEELIGISRIASDELKTSGILSKPTIARINSIQLQAGIRSPLTSLGYKLQSPLEFTGEMSHLQWPFKQDFPFIRSLRVEPSIGEWTIGGKTAEYAQPIVRFRNPVVRIETISGEPKSLVYTKGVSTYVTRRGFPANAILDQYGRPLTWPDGSYILRGEFPVPRIKSPYPDDTIIGTGMFKEAPETQTYIKVGDIRTEIERTGIQGAIDRWGETTVTKYFPSVKQIINDPQFKLLQQLREKQFGEVFKKGMDIREEQIMKSVEEAIQRKYVLHYNEDDYVRIWDRIEKEVDDYLGVTDDNFVLLTPSQKSAREALIRSKMSEYLEGSPLIDTGTYETFLERSGLMKEIPYRETFDRWWPVPTQEAGFDPYILGFGGEPLTPIPPVNPSRLSIIGGMMLKLNPMDSVTVFDASILTQNQIATLVKNGGVFNAEAQTMTVPYEVAVESPESLAGRLEPMTTAYILAEPIAKTEQMAISVTKPEIAPKVITIPVVEGEVSPAPTPILEPSPIPEPIPMVIPTPEPTPIPEPMPEPIPQAEPIPVPQPMPIPIPTPIPSPISISIPTPELPVRIGLPPIIYGSGGKELTKEQLEGAIGWKQGIMYKYIYPPYGQEDIINSRSPIQGIPIKEGIRSAYETIIRTRKGYIPPNIYRHMGMMDIMITDADKNGQPEIKFIEREQRKGRGAVAKKKVSTPEVFTIKGY